MASKKLSYDQIADEKDILKPLADSVNRVVESLRTMEVEFKKNIELSNEIAQTKAFKNVKDINDVEEAISKVAKESENLDKIEKQRLKLEERLEALNDDRIKQNFKLQEQIKAQTKEFRQQAKEATTTLNAYQKLTKATNEAQAEFKKLAAEFGANSKEAKEARKRFNQLNDQLEEVNVAAKDGRRNVGRYADGFEEAGKRIGKATLIIGAIIQVFNQLRDIVSGNTEASAGFEKAFSRITIALQVFVNRAVKAFPLVIEMFTSFFDSVTSNAKNFATQLQINLLESINILGNFDDKILELRKSFEQSSKETRDFSDIFSDLTDVFEGSIDEYTDLIAKNDQLIDLTIAYRKEIIALEKENAKFIKQQTELQSLASDSTRSLQEQIDANEALLKVNQNIADNNIQIAQKEFELATRRAEINRGNLEDQEAAKDAFVNLEQVKAEAAAERFDIQREINQLEQDLIEQQLDILFDDADTRKTINEQIIADENATFTARRKALNENLVLAEETFKEQTKLVNDNLAEQGKAIIDFTALSQVESEKEITERLKNAGLSEILTTRALELLRERRLFLQDNAVAQQELTDAEIESNNIRKDIISQEEALAALRAGEIDSKDVLSKLEEARNETEIQNLKERIALIKAEIATSTDLKEEETQRLLQIQNELNNKLIDAEQQRIEKQKQLEQSALEERQRLQEAGIETLSTLSEKRTQKQIDEIDKTLEKEKERAEELKELAAEGNQDAQRSLAQQQQRQAQLEQQRKRALEREKREKVALSAIETFNSLVANGETVQSALVKTPTAIATLQTIIDALPIFHTGTDETVEKDSKKSGYIGNNEYLSVLQGGEKVFSESHSAMIPKGMSNYDVVLAAQSYKQSNVAGYDDSRLYKEMKETRLAIENKQMLTNVQWNSILGGFEEHIEQKGRFEKRITAKKGLSSRV